MPMTYVVSRSTTTLDSSLTAPTGEPSPAAALPVSSSRDPSVSFAPDLIVTDAVASLHGCTSHDPMVPRPPPEPPPGMSSPIVLDDVLDCVPPETHYGFAAQFIEDSLMDLHHRVPEGLQTPVARLVFPDSLAHPTPSVTRRALVEYALPMEKACRPPPDICPQGSIMDSVLMVRPASPTTPFEFPFDMPTLSLIHISEPTNLSTSRMPSSA